MQIRRHALFLGLLLLHLQGSIWTSEAHAQDLTRSLVELRGGATLPPPDLIEGSAGGPAAATEILLGLRVSERLMLYGGSSLYGLDRGTVETNMGWGLAAGLRAVVPVLPPAISWISGGILLHQMRAGFDDSQGGVKRARSEPALGWEIGLGGALPLAPKLVLTPGLRVRDYTATYDLSEIYEDRPAARRQIGQAHFVLDLGLQYHWR